MLQTIIVFLLFIAVVGYQAYKFFRKKKDNSNCGCSSTCDIAKKAAKEDKRLENG